ncbi:alginate export family protein [Alloacidobacterium dinghuense]|uniref:Alginate export family protein n=1 Tax=Alloacidobacterium dinghuense TaxID=2763107 RepID=A0A7G8BLH5_9BACT|nr:alginate export family protein [Alloacidobacterium dinghuense]QNI33395.1 alginate export family protein [Alloacidobacterium dinghuense]
MTEVSQHISTRTKQHFRMQMLALIGICMTPCLMSYAQAQVFADYPQTRGRIEQLKQEDFPSWLSLDMQIRLRTEDQTSYQYIPGNSRVYELTRVYGGLTLQPASYLTGYVQFIDTHALGLPVKHVAANMRDVFDLRQGYLEYHHDNIRLYAGRRELKYGDERVVGISDFTNNSRTWDGFFGHFGDKTGKNKVDVFSTSVVTVHPTSLDKHGAGLTFHGVYGTIGSWIPNSILQPFVLVRALPRVKSQQGIYGSEIETTFGAEMDGRLPGSFEYDVLGDLQRGSYSNDSIHAGAGIVKVAHVFTSLPWKLRLGGEYDYATGNPHQNPNRISTYDQQYPSNHNAFGLFDLFGFQNIRERRVNLDLAPTENLSLLFQGEALGVSSRFDSVYDGVAGVVVQAPAHGFATNNIGDGFDASAKYVFHNYWVLNAGVGHFFPGSLMAANSHGAPLTYSYFSITYRFKLGK